MIFRSHHRFVLIAFMLYAFERDAEMAVLNKLRIPIFFAVLLSPVLDGSDQLY